MSSSVTDNLTYKNDADEPMKISSPIRLIHWVSAGFILLSFSSVFLRDLIDLPGADKALLNLHRSLGVCILGLTFLRYVARATGQLSKSSKIDLLRFAALVAHSAMYFLLVAVPVLGWLLTNARGMSVSFFGVADLPVLVGRNRDFAEILEGWHENAAWLLLALIGCHLAAAIWHLFIRRDGVVNAMLGRRSA